MIRTYYNFLLALESRFFFVYVFYRNLHGELELIEPCHQQIAPKTITKMPLIDPIRVLIKGVRQEQSEKQVCHPPPCRNGLTFRQFVSQSFPFSPLPTETTASRAFEAVPNGVATIHLSTDPSFLSGRATRILRSFTPG